MTPEQTVQSLAGILERHGAFFEDDVYAEMERIGIPARDADRAYKFSQIACGRVLLDAIVARFAEEYFCLNASGEIIESGRIEREPFFAAAQALVATRRAKWVARLGAMSADLAAINELLKRGSKPGNLVDKADQLIRTHL